MKVNRITFLKVINAHVRGTTFLVLAVAAVVAAIFQSERSLRVVGGLLQVLGVITTVKAIQLHFKTASGGSEAPIEVGADGAARGVNTVKDDELQNFRQEVREQFDAVEKKQHALSERIESEARTRQAWNREVLALLRTPWALVGVVWVVAGLIIVIIADACL